MGGRGEGSKKEKKKRERKEHRKRGYVKHYKILGQEAQDYYHVAKNPHQQPPEGRNVKGKENNFPGKGQPGMAAIYCSIQN